MVDEPNVIKVIQEEISEIILKHLGDTPLNQLVIDWHHKNKRFSVRLEINTD